MIFFHIVFWIFSSIIICRKVKRNSNTSNSIIDSTRILLNSILGKNRRMLTKNTHEVKLSFLKFRIKYWSTKQYGFLSIESLTKRWAKEKLVNIKMPILNRKVKEIKAIIDDCNSCVMLMKYTKPIRRKENNSIKYCSATLIKVMEVYFIILPKISK